MRFDEVDVSESALDAADIAAPKMPSRLLKPLPKNRLEKPCWPNDRRRVG